MQLEKIVQTWYSIAQGNPIHQSDVFFQFVAVWIAFNALYSSTNSSETGDFAQVRAFAGIPEVVDRHRHLIEKDDEYQQAVDTLAENGVMDLNSNQKRRIFNQRNLNQIASCLYQVRCNLFHGGKTPIDPRDKRLVTASYIIVTKLITPFLNQEFIYRNGNY